MPQLEEEQERRPADELALEVQEQEQEEMPASKAAAAREGWFAGVDVSVNVFTPGLEKEEGDAEAPFALDGEAPGGLVLLTEEQKAGTGMQQEGDKKIAASAMGGRWKPKRPVPAPDTQVQVSGSVDASH
jgi:hypothetical protein